MIDVLGQEKCRRRTIQEKIAIVQQRFEPEMTVSLVTQQHGVITCQFFLCIMVARYSITETVSWFLILKLANE